MNTNKEQIMDINNLTIGTPISGREGETMHRHEMMRDASYLLPDPVSPDSPYYRSSELAVIESNARLICAAPPLLKVSQKLLLWMEECMAACDFNQDDMDLYHELRQTIRTAGGFSSETHWWQGPCICDACGHAWQGVVEIPVEATGPQIPLECSECHQMTGGPA